MRVDQPVIEGRFLRRYKRFFADVELADGSVVTAHCPNTGSMIGCLAEGSRAVLRDSQNAARKLRYVLQALEVSGTLVNVDTSLPNAVVYRAVLEGRIPELAGYDSARREVPYGKSSRIDLFLDSTTRGGCWVEIKNTTLVEDGIAQFPDAPTERGLKHLGELTKLARRKKRAVQFFFVSRSDVQAFRPADAIDPEYARALRKAARAGVEIMAWVARVRPNELDLERPLRVELEPR
jgi:sugar fermentation stimulation protein A